MKKIVLLLLIVSPVFAFAEPFLVCDPQEGVTYYSLSLGTDSVVTVAESNGSLRYDVGKLPAGNTSGSVRAGRAYTLGGEAQEAMEWSSPLPFVLGKPATPRPPTNIRLAVP